MIVEKMKWVSRRKTTRVEDIAYSLIGLFDVSLTSAYGEGERAFYRLQLAIMEKSTAVDLLAWRGEGSNDNTMLARSPACFAGERQLDDLGRMRMWMLREDRWRLRVLDGHIWRGNQSYAMTNAGLRVDLVLYDVACTSTHARRMWHTATQWNSNFEYQDTSGLGTEPITHSSSTAVATAAKFACADAHTIIDIQSGQSLTLDLGDVWLSRKQLKATLAILDYEWDDAVGKPDSFKQLILEHNHTFKTLPGSSTGAIEDHIIDRRWSRAYTGVLLERVREVGRVMRFRRFLSDKTFHVQRPGDGWKQPETV